MNVLKTLLLATVCVVAVSAPAFANGTAPAASDSMWEGAYVGAQIGGGFAATDAEDLDDWYTTGVDGQTDTAFVGGFKAGYDWVNGNTIYGIFANYDFSNLDTVKEVHPSNPYYKLGSEIDGLGSIRGKLGLTSGDLAGFFSLGLGYQNADDKYVSTDSSPYSISQDSDDWGWAFGFGADYSIGNNSFIGFDASHYIFGEETHEVIDSGSGSGYFYSFENTVSTGQITYTYKFN